MKTKYKHIFEPFTIRRMKMKNGIIMTPMGTPFDFGIVCLGMKANAL